MSRWRRYGDSASSEALVGYALVTDFFDYRVGTILLYSQMVDKRDREGILR